MELLTNRQLNDLCSFLSTANYVYYPVATDFFLDLFNTGCRPNELVAVNRWSIAGNGTVQLMPLKGNDFRTFEVAEISPSLLFAIQYQIPPYDGLSLRQLQSVLKKIIPYLRPATVLKSAIAYIFRYNRVKQMSEAGKSVAGIQSSFGWSNPLMVTGYSNSVINVLNPLPSFENYFIVTDDDILIVTANGDNLIFQ